MRSRHLYIVGAALSILGSFLPWEQGGDLVSYWKYGVSVYPYKIGYWLSGMDGFPVEDNGGLLFLSISVLVMIIVFFTPGFLKKPHALSIVCAVTMILLAAYHISNLLQRRAELHYVFWAPQIEIGLVLVAFGSLLLLGAGISGYRKNDDLTCQHYAFTGKKVRKLVNQIFSIIKRRWNNP